MLSPYCNLCIRSSGWWDQIQLVSCDVMAPKEEVPQGVLAKVEIENCKGEKGCQEKRLSRWWTLPVSLAFHHPRIIELCFWNCLINVHLNTRLGYEASIEVATSMQPGENGIIDTRRRRAIRFRCCKQWTRRGSSSSWFLLVFDAEENVDEVCRNQDKVEPKDCCPAKLRGGWY